jgi:hypothetical protein
MGEVVQFPNRVEKPKRRRWGRWRPMTAEEYKLVHLFMESPKLCESSPFVCAMIDKAYTADDRITDRQGEAMRDVARDWGLMGSPPADEPAAS